MNKKNFVATLGALAAATAFATLAGCADTFCDIVACTDGAGGNPTGGGGAGTMATMTTSSGMGGMIDPHCDPMVIPEGTVIDDGCGIFVNPESDTMNEDGTKAAPYKRLSSAVADPDLPQDKSIYVCGMLDESVTITSRKNIFGGINCADYSTTTMKTPWTAPENNIPLRIEGSFTARLARFAITAQNANGADVTTKQGYSSIAALIEAAQVTLEEVDLVAGAGDDGLPGADHSGLAPGQQSDAMAFNGDAGAGCAMSAPGDKSYVCPAGGMPVGGGGGPGSINSGFGGLPGFPDHMLGPPNGAGGMGDQGAGWTCGANMGQGNGKDGHEAPAVSPGVAGTTMGTLGGPLGFTGDAGGDGPNGLPGQGGGGGGGRAGSQTGCAGMTGPTGGTGGVGGCGGLGGGGGGAGGASIALVSINAMLTLSSVTLRAADGGAGGEGGDRQFGGAGGSAGPGGLGFGCPGGNGGAGAAGGTGGGGAGGPSIGLAYVGMEPSIEDAAITVAMNPSAGGLGGNGNIDGNNGAMGAPSKKRQF